MSAPSDPPAPPDISKIYDDPPTDPPATPPTDPPADPPADPPVDPPAPTDPPADPPASPPADPPVDGDDPPAPGEPEPDPPADELKFAPEEGYTKFTYDESMVSTVDEQLETGFMELAKKLNGGKGLNQVDAQAVVDFQAAQIQAMERGVAAQRQEWRDQGAEHPKYGGSKYEASGTAQAKILTMWENQAIADGYAPALGLKAVLDNTGLGDHPAAQAFFAWVGNQLAVEPPGPIGDPTPITPPAEVDYTTNRGRAVALFGSEKAEGV